MTDSWHVEVGVTSICCRRCGAPIGVQRLYCSRDCANGFTRMESFEDYYARMHPARLGPRGQFRKHLTGTEPVPAYAQR
jgi:hypothetical protein